MNRSSVIVKRTRNGKGLFATKPFHKEETILQIKGKRVHWKKLLKIGGTLLDNSFRLSKEYYLNPEGELGALLNHSCNPNCRLAKKAARIFLVAVKQIIPGEEITLDYSTILADDDIWTMKCNCGVNTCRKTIKAWTELPKQLKRCYLAEDIIPSYIAYI